MVSVVHLPTETQRSIVNYAMALITDVLAKPNFLFLSIAIMAKGTILVPYKTRIRQWNTAPFAGKAFRMPISRHGLDYATNNKVVALVATGRKQDMKILLAVLTTLKFIENAILELAETLGAYKALRVP